MRRFSQRSALVTLSEINITPLLDLAFVLLIIFIITTPLLEQSMPMKLPSANGSDVQKVDPRNIHTVEIGLVGNNTVYRLDHVPMQPDEIERILKQDFN